MINTDSSDDSDEHTDDSSSHPEVGIANAARRIDDKGTSFLKNSTVLAISFSKISRVPDDIYISLFIFNHHIRAICDTGCGVNLIRYELWTGPISPSNCVLQVADGRPLEIIGEGTTEIVSNGKSFPVRFIISSF